MIKLSIEQKAKAYDKAIERAKDQSNKYCLDKIVLEEIFPELKESEDERMRNAAINACKYMVDNFENSTKQYEDAIAWLEKQGEKDEEILILKDQIESLHAAIKAVKETYRIELEKQGEQKSIDKIDSSKVKKDPNPYWTLAPEYQLANKQKPADKVEPKFRNGDWIVDKQGIVHQIANVIENVTNHTYGYDTVNGEYFNDYVSGVKLWTIQDAKDGDVLISSGNVKYSNGIKYERIYLFNNFDNAYFTLTKFSNHVEEYDINVNVDYPDNTVPATKEQKEILFMVMKEAGYEWDADKKELKKIEQKPADLPNGKDYGIDGLYAAIDILQKTLGKVEGYQTDDGILEHECAISAVKELSKHKPAWDEEDEKMIQDIINDIAIAQELVYCKSRCEDEINWLKSLKDKVQPKSKQEWSEEDEYNIAFIVELLYGIEDSDKEYENKCRKMANWLKSLRPQNWTKEDKERYISCLQRLGTGNPEQPETINSKWFKEHVYPQSTWKPSDKQMEALYEET